MEHYFKKAKFITSVVDMKQLNIDRKNEVVFVGKSNVGKSSLINALVNQKRLAFTSSNPGHTRLLNYYLIEDEFYFVDCPGYGYSSKKGLDYKFYGDMVEGYFDNNEHLKLIVLLLDSRHVPTDDDLDFYEFLLSLGYKFVICMTKCDKLNMSMKSKILNNLKTKLNYSKDVADVILTSVNDPRTILKLKEYINEAVRGN